MSYLHELFIFCSGYFFNEDYVNRKSEFIIKRIKGLYLNFLKYELLFLALVPLFYILGFIEESSFSIKDYLLDIRTILCFQDSAPFLGPLWFLRSLFVVNISFITLFDI